MVHLLHRLYGVDAPDSSRKLILILPSHRGQKAEST